VFIREKHMFMLSLLHPYTWAVDMRRKRSHASNSRVNSDLIQQLLESLHHSAIPANGKAVAVCLWSDYPSDLTAILL
jgi:hypothetical protein